MSSVSVWHHCRRERVHHHVTIDEQGRQQTQLMINFNRWMQSTAHEKAHAIKETQKEIHSDTVVVLILASLGPVRHNRHTPGPVGLIRQRS